jgi:hypothetical protein
VRWLLRSYRHLGTSCLVSSCLPRLPVRFVFIMYIIPASTLSSPPPVHLHPSLFQPISLSSYHDFFTPTEEYRYLLHSSQATLTFLTEPSRPLNDDDGDGNGSLNTPRTSRGRHSKAAAAVASPLLQLYGPPSPSLSTVAVLCTSSSTSSITRPSITSLSPLRPAVSITRT